MKEAMGLRGGFLGGRVRESTQAAQEGTSLHSSPRLSQGTYLCFQWQGAHMSLENDPVMFPGRRPGVEHLEMMEG